MKEIKVTESKIAEALVQIDTFTELGPKERGCLRLLAEEMYSMCKELLGVEALDFVIKQDGNNFALSGITETRINETAREQLISVSSTGKNAANKGIKGMLGAVIECFSIEGTPDMHNVDWACGMSAMGDCYMPMWTLSRYIEVAGDKNTAEQWDGLEKSIIANFADDVSIGVRSGKLEMMVTKTF